MEGYPDPDRTIAPMAELPIVPRLPELVELVRRERGFVLVAEPGAGKTTLLPPALLDAVRGEVWVLEPRRIAARLAARFVARSFGEEPGGLVGWRVRHEDVGGPRTRLRYVTEGVLARRLATDPRLEGVGAVVLDEFHERHLEGDLALALLARLRRTSRSDLAIALMSATLDPAPLAAWLGAPAVSVPGRLHPIEVEYLPQATAEATGRLVAGAVAPLAVGDLEGDVLVFLPGAAEIRRAAAALEGVARERGLAVVALHGSLPPEEQDRALRPTDRRKVILSTNVAESSITVEGVVAVVDSGLERVAVDDPWSGLSSLEVRPVSRASATQRAARAGRTRPGRCLRLYTRRDHDARPERALPEVLRLDLSGALLAAAGAGAGEIPWLDPPPPDAVRAAQDLLARLGAIDGRGALTAIGRRMIELPLPPRLARLVVEGVDRGAPGTAAAAAAALAERDVRTGSRDHGNASGARSDLLALADLLEEARRARFAPARLRALGLDPTAARNADRAAQQIRRLAGRGPGPADEDEAAFLRAVLSAFPDRVARRRGSDVRALTMADGRVATLGEESVVREAPWLVVADAVSRRDGIFVRVASAIEPDWLIDLPDGVREVSDVSWDAARERVVARTRLVHGALTVDEEPAARPSPEEARRVLEKEALAAGPAAFLDPEALAAFLARVAFVRTLEPDLPELGEGAVRLALAELCEGRTSFEELRRAGLLARVKERLPAARRSLVERLAPEWAALPGGRRVRIHYEPGKAPWVASRMQDFFGLTRGPAVGGGRTPLVLHLLAPNQRPVQITSDLAGFWERHYPAVRRELCRKYPRHAWPEDPLRGGK